MRSRALRQSTSFDQHHDLRKLCKKAQLQTLIHPADRRKADAWLGDVWTRWKNNYRFVSDDRMRSELNKLGHDRGIKGNFLKENSRVVMEAAYQLRTLGEKRWHSKKT